MVHVIQNKEDLNKKIAEAGDKLVVIDFYANWCGPCKVISPKLEELSGLYAEQAMILKINVDDCEDLAVEYNVTSMPTFVFIRNNKVIEFFVGGNTEKLVRSVEKHVGVESAVSQANVSVGGTAAPSSPVAAITAIDSEAATNEDLEDSTSITEAFEVIEQEELN